MRSFCPKCLVASDFVDLNTGCCEICLPDYAVEVGGDNATEVGRIVATARLVSVQTAVGITKRATVQVEERQRKASQARGNRA